MIFHGAPGRTARRRGSTPRRQSARDGHPVGEQPHVRLRREFRAPVGGGRSNWDLTTLAGAGALRSTANDMLTFLAANLGYTESPLSAAMTAMLSVRRSTGR